MIYYYVPEPLESHREHEESRCLWTPLFPSHVRGTHFLSIRVDVLNQRPIEHHETRRLPSSPVRHGVMMQRKHVRASVARSSKRHVCRRLGKERARRRGKLEEHAVVVRQREVQRRDVRRPLGRGSASEAVDPNLAAVFERRDHVRPRRKKRKVPNPVGRLGLLNVL